MTKPIWDHFPKYTTRGLLQLTAGLAGALAIGQLLDPQLRWALWLIAYAFAPTIALTVLFLLRKQPMSVRSAAAMLAVVVLASTTIVMCGLRYGLEAMQLTILGALIEWPGQLALLLCLYFLLGGFQSSRTQDGSLPEA